jgi:putative PIN family toxin of toxin-antitoxin system
MLRVVLDTNVVVSATLVKEGAPNQILETWKQGEVELVTSPVLLEELQEVLKRPRIQKQQWMTQDEVEEFYQLLKDTALQTSGQKLVEAVSEDPDDDFVISAALEGKADYIVSGDEHLLGLKKWEEIPILPPREFLELLRSGARFNTTHYSKS